MRLIDADAILYREDDSGIKSMAYVRKGQIDSMPTIESEIHYNTESWKTTATDLTPVEYAPVKHGRWETLKNGHDAVCTNCRMYWISIEDKYDFWFCPRCGADMRERREDGNTD